MSHRNRSQHEDTHASAEQIRKGLAPADEHLLEVIAGHQEEGVHTSDLTPHQKESVFFFAAAGVVELKLRQFRASQVYSRDYGAFPMVVITEKGRRTLRGY